MPSLSGWVAGVTVTSSEVLDPGSTATGSHAHCRERYHRLRTGVLRAGRWGMLRIGDCIQSTAAAVGAALVAVVVLISAAVLVYL